MAKTSKATIGTKDEQKLFWEVEQHRTLAQEDLDNRITDFDSKDELFRNYLNESTWPYRALVTDPRVWTAIIEKTSRLIAGKPKGELQPREGGDVLKAKINNELLNFQWDDVSRIEGDPMIAKWAMMDMNARKYGASFGLVPWHWEKRGKEIFFDGPNFKVLNNRDVLLNPSYSSIKGWFQYREYPTLEELEKINNASSGPPIYKNLKILKDVISDQEKEKGGAGGDLRSANYQSRNKSISGIEDYLGRDITRKVVEVVHELRPDRWISFAPRHGVIIRDIPNPCKHAQIPVVLLKYYVIDDDIYGLSEVEPIERLQKALNALICQYLDTVNTDLYPPLKIRSTGVRMPTIEFGPNKKWIMNDPQTDVIRMETSTASTGKFTQTYSFMVAAMMNALGESSLGISNVGSMQQRKTAQEVKSLMSSQNARDNYNQIYLSEAVKRQMMFWHLMNQQFIFSDPTKKNLPLRLVGDEASKFFEQAGLSEIHPTEEDALMLNENPETEVKTGPEFPIEVGGEIRPKLEKDKYGTGSTLYIVPEDMVGTYDYKADITSMAVPDDYAQKQALTEALAMIIQNYQLLMQEGYRPKIKDLMVRALESTPYFKDADNFFEKVEGGVPNDQTGLGTESPAFGGGEGPMQGGGAPPGGSPPKGMGGGSPAMAGGVPKPLMGQPQGM